MNWTPVVPPKKGPKNNDGASINVRRDSKTLRWRVRLGPDVVERMKLRPGNRVTVCVNTDHKRLLLVVGEGPFKVYAGGKQAASCYVEFPGPTDTTSGKVPVSVEGSRIELRYR